MDKKYHLWNILIACDTIITRVQGSAGRHVWLDPCLEPELRTRYRGGRVSMAVQCPWRCHDAGIPARTWHFVCRFSGSVGIRIAYSACFKTLPHVLTYTVQYWVVFINMFHTAHPICEMGQCNGSVFATCRLRNLSAGASEDAGVLENVTYLLVAPDMWHG